MASIQPPQLATYAQPLQVGAMVVVSYKVGPEPIFIFMEAWGPYRYGSH